MQGRGGRGGRSGGGGGRGGRGGRGPGGGMREGGMRGGGGGRSSYSEGQAALPTTVTHTSRRPRRPDMQSADDFPSLGGHSNGGASHSAAAPRPRRGASSERMPRVEGAAGGRGAGSRGASDRAGGAAVPAAAGPVYVPLARVTGSGGRGDRSSASGQSRPHPYGSEYAAGMGGGRGRGGGSGPVRSYEASSAIERGSHGLPR